MPGGAGAFVNECEASEKARWRAAITDQLEVSAASAGSNLCRGESEEKLVPYRWLGAARRIAEQVSGLVQTRSD